MSGNVYKLSKTMKSVGNNLWKWVKTLKRDCGSVRIIADHDPRIMRILKISLEWVYIIFNWKLLGKTQGKREHQGPSVINKPRLWGQNVIWTSAVQMYPHLAVHSGWPAVQMCQNHEITWFDVRKRLQTLKNDEKCWKQSLVVGQNT